MLRTTTLLVALALALASSSAVEARPRPTQSSKRFEANKKFGLGLELGQPSGLTGKYFLSASGALDFGIGAVYGWRGRDGFHLYADYLWHPVSLVSAEAFELPLYFGVGGRVWNYDDYDRNDRFDGRGSAFGLRVPAGIAFDFNNVPLDIFLQLAFTFDFLTYRSDDFYTDLNFSVGIRYWFD